MREWIGMGLEIGIYSPDFPILLGDLKRGMRQKDDDRNRNRNKRQRGRHKQKQDVKNRIRL